MSALNPKTKVHDLSHADRNALSLELDALGCRLHAAGPLMWLYHHDSHKHQEGGILLGKNKTVFDVRGMATVIDYRCKQLC